MRLVLCQRVAGILPLDPGPDRVTKAHTLQWFAIFSRFGGSKHVFRDLYQDHHMRTAPTPPLDPGYREYAMNLASHNVS